LRISSSDELTKQSALVPEANFPVQLKQAVSAIQFLLAAGTHPSNIQITGDSAGGNLAAQVLAHMLHPVPGVPVLSLPPNTKFGSFYLISPWTDLTGQGVKSFDENDGSDMFSKEVLRGWGTVVLAGTAREHHKYLEPNKTPKGWFEGVDKLTKGILVSVGEKEILRDTGKALYEDQLKPYHPQARFVEQKWGIHVDLVFFFDLPFGLGEEKDKGELMPIVLDWIHDGFGEN
jgi:acetyl esterase/lipase